MAAEHKHLGAGADVPHAAHAVAAPRHEQVQGGVQRQAVHAAQVAVVVADDLGGCGRVGWGGRGKRGRGTGGDVGGLMPGGVYATKCRSNQVSEEEG